LLDALRRRLALGRPFTGALTLASATPAERQALDSLLGRPATRGDSLRVDLDALSETLAAASLCASLREAVETLLGPVPNRRAEAEQTGRSWAAVQAEAAAAFAPWPSLRLWLDDLFATGLLKRLAPAPAKVARLLSELAHLSRALPAAADPLATLAARLFGDAHALDPGTLLATLAVRAAALLGNTPFEDDAESRREAWASVGVLCDELSTPALVLNLPAAADTPTARLLRTARADAEPLHLTLRHLMLWPLASDPALADLDVFVCENPTIVALAARRLCARCAPLVCVNGQYATPSKILLRQLSAAGARLRYHGDFDVGGLRIARRVLQEPGATPWRMCAADYQAAPKGKTLPPDTLLASPWDPVLAEVMQRERRAVHEEAVAEILLRDLALSSAAQVARGD
jgi:uncharacterized protein (TIGR02679 family)